MSAKTVYVCEGCAAECENPCAAKGWVQISGSISRAHSKYGKSSYESDYLGGSPTQMHHFCSVGCIEKALNKCGEEKANAK